MSARVGNIVDQWDAAIDEFQEGGGSLDEWHKLEPLAQMHRVDEVVSNRIVDGFWFRWSDKTVRDWPEDNCNCWKVGS